MILSNTLSSFVQSVGFTPLRQFLHSLVESSVDESVVEITLINKANIQPPFHNVNNPFLELLSHLGSYGGLLYSQSLRHFDKQPYWCRTTASI